MSTGSRSVEELISKAMEAWEEKAKYLEEGGDVVYAFLELARCDLKLVMDDIKCNYCRRQAKAEYELIGHALDLARMANQWMYSDSKKEKLALVFKAIKKIAEIAALQVKKSLM